MNGPLNRSQAEFPPQMRVGQEGIASDEHPDENQDAMLQQEDAFGVFDGMGGYAGGKVASDEAMNAVGAGLRAMPQGLSVSQVAGELVKVLKQANEHLLAMKRAGGKYENMGTTATLVKLVRNAEGKRQAVVANVGDSRVYVWRAKSKRLEQITLDDGIGSGGDEQKARALQERLANVSDLSQLSPQEQDLFQNRNQIMQALGLPSIEPKTYVTDLEPGDKLVLSSDGIHDNLTQDEMNQIMAGPGDANALAKNLAKAAQVRGRVNHLRSKKDDMSAMVVEFPEDGSVRQESAQAEQAPAAAKESSLDELTKQVEDAESIGDLRSLIERRGSYPTSTGEQVAAATIASIEDYVAGRRELDAITRQGGLRYKVEELVISSQLSQIKTSDELLAFIDRYGDYPTSDGRKPASFIKERVLAYLEGQQAEDVITRKGGLRKRAIEIKKIEGVKKRLSDRTQVQVPGYNS